MAKPPKHRMNFGANLLWQCYDCGGVSMFISKEWSFDQLLEFEKYYDWEFMIDYNPNLYEIIFNDQTKDVLL